MLLCFFFVSFFVASPQPHELEDPVGQGQTGRLAHAEEILPAGHGHPGQHDHGRRLGDRWQVLCPHEVLRRGKTIKCNGLVMMAAGKKRKRGYSLARMCRVGLGRVGARWAGTGQGGTVYPYPSCACVWLFYLVVIGFRGYSWGRACRVGSGRDGGSGRHGVRWGGPVVPYARPVSFSGFCSCSSPFSLLRPGPLCALLTACRVV